MSDNSLMPSLNRYASDHAQIDHLRETCNKEQLEIIASAIEQAYKKGQDDSDARTARLMARVFSAFIGVTAGIDQNGHDGGSEASKIRRMLSIIRGG